MTEEPPLGVRRTPTGTHALGKTEYEVKDGAVVYQPGGTLMARSRAPTRSSDRSC